MTTQHPMTFKHLWLLTALAIIGLILVWNVATPKLPVSTPPQTITYACNEGKSITATLFEGSPAPTPAPGEPPTPTGRVDLTLSDGRSLSLKQTLSADGVRYANDDESFVFWSKGNGALVLENNVEKSFINCIETAASSGDLTQVYHGDSFTLRLPEGYRADSGYRYQNLGPGKEIAGVAFVVSTSTYAGTNLSSDTYISVETIPNVSDCSAGLFLERPTNLGTTTSTGVDYSFGVENGAGAGNRYDEIVYARLDTNPCVAVRYFIHYGAIENYPEGMVKEFDKAALLEEFDAIRHSLTLAL